MSGSFSTTARVRFGSVRFAPTTNPCPRWSRSDSTRSRGVVDDWRDDRRDDDRR